MRWAIILLLLMPMALAQPTSISIITLEYDQGDVEVVSLEKAVGYFPDRPVQPEGYALEVMQGENVLYGMSFLPPTFEYEDGNLEDVNLGRVRYQDVFQFSFIVPGFPQQDSIVVSNPEGIEEDVMVFEPIPILSPQKPTFWIVLLIFVIALFIVLIIMSRLRTSPASRS